METPQGASCRAGGNGRSQAERKIVAGYVHIETELSQSPKRAGQPVRHSAAGTPASGLLPAPCGSSDIETMQQWRDISNPYTAFSVARPERIPVDDDRRNHACRDRIAAHPRVANGRRDGNEIRPRDCQSHTQNYPACLPSDWSSFQSQLKLSRTSAASRSLPRDNRHLTFASPWRPSRSVVMSPRNTGERFIGRSLSVSSSFVALRNTNP